MKTRVLRLNDGRAVEVTMCGQVGNLLTIELAHETSVQDAVSVFGEISLVEHMSCDFGSEITETYDGFTRLRAALTSSETNRVIITLEKC